MRRLAGARSFRAALGALALLAAGPGAQGQTAQSPQTGSRDAPVRTETSPLDGATVHLTDDAARLAPFSIFRECDLCPEMIVLPGGRYVIGSPEDEAGRTSDEGPRRDVTVGAFALARTETTLAAFQRFIDASGYEARAGCSTYGGGAWGRDADGSWAAPGFEQTPEQPVVCVSWRAADVFVEWLNTQVEGAPYRLPSEAEWEYAARGGRTTAYFFGSTISEGCGFLNGADAATTRAYPQLGGVPCEDGFAETAPVGRFKPNPFGLYDMLGNAQEWTQDCFLWAIPETIRDGSANFFERCRSRTVRGGAWNYSPDFLRVANRVAMSNSTRNALTGFRLARSIER